METDQRLIYGSLKLATSKIMPTNTDGTDAVPARFQDVDRHAAELEANGCTIIPDAIPNWLLDGLTDVIKDIEKNHAENQSMYVVDDLNNIAGGDTFRAVNLLALDPFFQKAFEFDPLLAFAERILGRGMLLHTCQTLYVGPGEKKQPLHTDDMQTLKQLRRPHPTILFNSIWALSDFTDNNGATRFVPGSHAWPDTPRPTLEEVASNPSQVETACAEMKRGSMLIFDGALWHGAGTNQSNDRRLGLCVAYCAGWIRQQENFQLSLPVPLVKTFSRRLQELCGFGLYAGFVGGINGMSPVDVLLSD